MGKQLQRNFIRSVGIINKNIVFVAVLSALPLITLPFLRQGKPPFGLIALQMLLILIINPLVYGRFYENACGGEKSSWVQLFKLHWWNYTFVMLLLALPYGALFFFGSGHMGVYDFRGREGWSDNIADRIGGFAFLWTFSSSPLLHNGIVYQQILQRDEPVDGVGRPNAESFIMALDARTGRESFRRIRPSKARVESREAFTTPIIVNVNGRDQMVVIGGDCITGHDLRAQCRRVEVELGKEPVTPGELDDLLNVWLTFILHGPSICAWASSLRHE